MANQIRSSYEIQSFVARRFLHDYFLYELSPHRLFLQPVHKFQGL